MRGSGAPDPEFVMSGSCEPAENRVVGPERQGRSSRFAVGASARLSRSRAISKVLEQVGPRHQPSRFAVRDQDHGRHASRERRDRLGERRAHVEERERRVRSPDDSSGATPARVSSTSLTGLKPLELAM